MKKRRFGLSAYDRLLLLALAVGILLVYVRYRTLTDSPLTSNGESVAVSYTLQVDSLSRANAASEAKIIQFSDTKDLFGRIETPPEISTAYTEALRKNGSIAYLPSKHSYELRGTFFLEGSFTENGFFANGRRHITANQTVSAIMNGLNVTILILNISRFSSK